MQIIKIQLVIAVMVVFSAAGIVFGSGRNEGERIREPELPPVCSALEVTDGSRPFFHAFALGVQIYRWNGSDWDFVAPLANLYSDEDYHRLVGTHYAGPTWEHNSGSSVVASRADGCTPDPASIPWLLLDTVDTNGRGIFRKVLHIQRVNTVGGLKPSAPGLTVGQEARMPYTAEYFFYKGGDRQQ